MDAPFHHRVFVVTSEKTEGGDFYRVLRKTRFPHLFQELCMFYINGWYTIDFGRPIIPSDGLKHQVSFDMEGSTDDASMELADGDE